MSVASPFSAICTLTVDLLRDADGAWSDDLQLALQQCCTILGEKKLAQVALPLRDAAALQQLAQKAWNATASHIWPEKYRSHRVSLRAMIARAYLLAHNAYAPPEVQRRYFGYHPDEGERCVLLCLKSAREQAEEMSFDGPEDLLHVASTLSSFTAPPSAASLLLEVLFAQVVVLWRVKKFGECEQRARLLIREARSSHVYREALLRFVFSVSDEGVEDSREEPALRTLLTLGLELIEDGQTGMLVRSQFKTSLYIQMSASLLRTKMYEEALDYSTRALRELPSLEALMANLQALAHMNEADAAQRVFGQIASDAHVSLDDAFLLAGMLVATNSSCYAAVKRVLMDVVQPRYISSGMEQFSLRLISLLSHVATEESVADMLAWLRENAVIEGPNVRYVFSVLWMQTKSDISHHLRVKVLQTALTCSSAASVEEVEAIAVALSLSLFQVRQEGATSIDDCRGCLDVLEGIPSVSRTPRAAECICFLHYLLKDGEACLAAYGAQIAHRKLESQQVAISSNLIRMLMTEGAVATAARVAQRCLHSTKVAHIPLAVDEQRHLLRMFCVGLIQSASRPCGEDLELILDALPSALQDNGSDNEEDVWWWCRALWLVANDVLGETAIELLKQAVRLSSAAADYFATSIATPDASKIALWSDQLCVILREEFRLFAIGHPQLLPEDISRYLTNLVERGSTDVTLLAARAELILRSQDAWQDSDIFDSVAWRQSKAQHQDYETLAMCCASVSLHNGDAALRALAVSIQLESLSAECEDNNTGSALIGHLKAYQFAADDSLLRLRVCDALQAALSTLRYPCPRTEDALSGELVLEHFAVESWNEAVTMSVASEAALAARWRSLALSFGNYLRDENPTKTIIHDFSAKLPVAC